MAISPVGQPPGFPDWDGPEPEEPSDAELLGAWPDPFAGPPDDGDAWLADLSVAELEPPTTGLIDQLPGLEAGRILECRTARSGLDGLAGLAIY